MREALQVFDLEVGRHRQVQVARIQLVTDLLADAVQNGLLHGPPPLWGEGQKIPGEWRMEEPPAVAQRLTSRSAYLGFRVTTVSTNQQVGMTDQPFSRA